MLNSRPLGRDGSCGGVVNSVCSDELVQSGEEQADLPNPAALPRPGGRRPLSSAAAKSQAKMRAAGRVVTAASRLRRDRVTMAFGEIQMTPIAKACADGQLERAKELLEIEQGKGEEALMAQLDAVDDWAGSTPLHWAAYAGSTELVQYLLELGARHDAETRRDGSLPLHLAARYGRTAVVELLVSQAPDKADHQNRVGNSPMLEAAKQGHPEVAKVLLAHDADLWLHNQPEQGGQTPLLAAVSAGRLDVVRVLLDADADPSTEAKVGLDPSSEWAHVPGQGAITAALASGHLAVLLELLERGWRPSGADRGRRLYVLNREQVENVVIRWWAQQRTTSAQMINKAETARLFALLVLSVKAERPGATPNPVKLALEASHTCSKAAAHRTRDKVMAARLQSAAATLELVACGLVDGARRAADEAADERLQYNPWLTGNSRVVPRTALEVFIGDSVGAATLHEKRLFVAHDDVYQHIQDIWGGDIWNPEPSAASAAVAVDATARPRSDSSGAGARGASLGLCRIPLMCAINLAVVPLLPFMPRSLELALIDQIHASAKEGEAPFGIVWLLPTGRFWLWFSSTLGLAMMLSFMPPLPSPSPYDVGSGLLFGLSWWEFGVLCYLGGFVEGELHEFGQNRMKYVLDPFNLLDGGMIVLMGGVLLCRVLALLSGDPAHFAPLLNVGIPMQAFAALLAWGRLLQTLFIFPESGPLLLMTMNMLNDLRQFLKLASVIVIAFTMAFLVLFTAADPTAQLTLPIVMEKLIEGAIGGEPYRVIEEIQDGGRAEGDATGGGAGGGGGVYAYGGEEAPLVLRAGVVATGVMLIFGIVVVLLLLNLLIARFAKTFDIVHEHVDSHFKLEFAKIVLEGRDMQIAPRPLNLVRRIVLALYARLHVPVSTTASTVATARSGGWARVDDSGRCSEGGRGGGSGGGGGGGGSEGAAPTSKEAREVAAFIEKAMAPQVKAYPEWVVEYVRKNQHNTNDEATWRTQTSAQVHELQHMLETARDEQRTAAAAAAAEPASPERLLALLERLEASIARAEAASAASEQQAQEGRARADKIDAMHAQIGKLEAALGALAAGAAAAGAATPAVSTPDTSPQGTPRGRFRGPRPSSPALGASRKAPPSASFKW